MAFWLTCFRGARKQVAKRLALDSFERMNDFGNNGRLKDGAERGPSPGVRTGGQRFDS